MGNNQIIKKRTLIRFKNDEITEYKDHYISNAFIVIVIWQCADVGINS